MYYLLWLAAIVIFSVTEILTMNLVTIWFAVGALFSLIAAMFDCAFILQLWIFVIASVAALIITKPIVKNKLKVKKTVTNADRIIGREGIVTKDIIRNEFSGEVKVCGQIWSAVGENDDPIPKDTRVTVIRIEGVKAIVKKEENEK